jgi:uncharacterized membrane protein
MSPKLLIKPLTAVSIVLVVFLLVYPAWMYGMLPERIPIHFNLEGEPDGWGSAGSVFVVPGVATGTYLLMMFLAFGGFLDQQSKDNPTHLPPAVLEVTRLMLVWVSFLTMALFSYVTWQAIDVAMGHISKMRSFPVAIYVAGVLLPIPYLMIETGKAKTALEKAKGNKPQ